MGRRGMPGRRRQVLQLDENAKTSYLTQTGCYRPDDMFVESKNSIKTGLSLVGEYSDSDSDSDKETEQNDPDDDSKPNGNAEKEEESQLVSENNESLQAEMLEIVGVKKETSADIFLREFQAYQKECSGPAYTREFIAFQKESKEEEEEEEVCKSSPLVTSRDVQKESSTKQLQDVSSLAKPDDETSSNKLKIPDIDSQVASFLAEIDALGDDDDNEEKVEEPSEAVICDKKSGLDPEANTQSSTALLNSKIKDKTNGKKATTDGKSKDEPEQKEIKQLIQSLPEEKIVWPEEPKTEWQQCYDENTQHCYYWNINTNAVTWEIPPEFTQYLLLYREYEQKVTKLIKEGKTKPSKKKSQKKSEKSKSKQTGSNSGTAPKDSNTQAQLEYGPHLPPSSHNQNDDTSSVSEKTAESPMNKEAAPKEPAEQPVYGPMIKPNIELENNKDKQDQSDSSSSPSLSNNAESERVEKMQDQQQHQHHHDEEEEKEEEEEENDGNKVNCKMKRDLSISATDNENIEKDSTPEGNDSNTFPNENRTEDSLTANLAMIELCKKKFKARISREEENGKPSTQSSSSSSGGKNSSVLTDFEEGLLDIDEVDRELELALERKKNELKCLEEEEEKLSHETEKRYEKRKYSNDRLSDESSTEEVVPPKSSKRSRDQRSRDHKDSSKHSKKSKHKKDDTNAISSDDSSPQSTTSKKSRSSDQKKSHRSHQSKKESRPKKSKELISKEHDNKLKFFDETEDNKLNELALDLSQLVMDKMDFLEIDISKQSKLQLLYVQLKTRISDWHAGGLSTKYLYVKLQETNEQLGQYEKSGAPAGWSVNWDRACKRYFYTNNTSGHSQWEYPEKGGNELADDLGSVASSSSSSSLPLPAHPPSFSCPSSEIDQEHQKKVAKELQRRAKSSSSSSSEKDKYSSSSKSEGRKEKRSKKESKSSKRSKDSSKSKSHSENSTCSKLKDYDCEMRIYPGEPPPPGTEENLQPSNMITSISAGESSELNNQSSNPQLKEESVLKLDQTNIDEEEKDETTLDTILKESTTKDILDSIAPNNIDDMEIDPEEEIVTPSPALPSTEFKTNSQSLAHNGKTVSVQDSAIIHNTNSSVVISKPPHITRPVQSVEHISGSTDSGLESSARTEAHVSEGSGVSHPSVSGLSELAKESSNSPKVVDNNEVPETIKNPKKKKKDKIITSTSLTLKKKNVSSLVQKWQKVKKEVEKEDELARHEFSDGD